MRFVILITTLIVLIPLVLAGCPSGRVYIDDESPFNNGLPSCVFTDSVACGTIPKITSSCQDIITISGFESCTARTEMPTMFEYVHTSSFDIPNGATIEIYPPYDGKTLIIGYINYHEGPEEQIACLLPSYSSPTVQLQVRKGLDYSTIQLSWSVSPALAISQGNTPMLIFYIAIAGLIVILLVILYKIKKNKK